MNWEFQYRGLTFGGGQDIGIRRVTGLSPPDVKLDDVSRAVDDGSWAYGDYSISRRIIIEGDYKGVDLDMLNEWRSAFARPATSPQPLVFEYLGSTPMRVNCIPTRRTFDMDALFSIGHGLWAVELLAQDPRIYDNTLSTLTGNGTAENAGTYPTYPVASITGASTNPKILNDTTGEFIELAYTLGGGNIINIDFQNRTIYEGATSRYSTLDVDSTWWDLEPGDNEIVFTGGGTLELEWRSAWL